MWLLLDINRNSYMESPTAPLDLALNGQRQGKPDFKALYLVMVLS